ncbi:MAG: magnesium transporter CorA family protein [Thaumarchaeota archaeon]|nr:magnesium transporter CorA family protein [Nitrososphaerota archaeon]
MASPPPGQRSASGAEDGRVSTITNGAIKWTEILDPTTTEMAMLASEYHFHPLDLEDSLSPRQLTKVEDHGDHIFISLHFPEEAGKGIIVSREVSMFMGKDYLVTIHPSSLKGISALFRSCRDDESERAELMKSSAYLGYRIIDGLVDGLFAILDDVQASLDSIEAVVFDEVKSTAGAINSARRQIAILRRVVYPLALYLPELVKAQKFSSEDLSLYFSDIRHKVGKASGTIEEMKEMVEIYKDTDFVTSSNRTNTVLSILTIIFTLTIPATVISSIYGMNVPLPGGAVLGPQGFLGIYTSAIFILLVMLIPAVAMVLYFRRVGWF